MTREIMAAMHKKSLLERIKAFFFHSNEEKQLRDRLEQRIIRDIDTGKIRFNQEGKIISTDEIKREFSKLERTVAELKKEQALADVQNKSEPNRERGEPETLIADLTHQLLREQEEKEQLRRAGKLKGKAKSPSSPPSAHRISKPAVSSAATSKPSVLPTPNSKSPSRSPSSTQSVSAPKKTAPPKKRKGPRTKKSPRPKTRQSTAKKPTPQVIKVQVSHTPPPPQPVSARNVVPAPRSGKAKSPEAVNPAVISEIKRAIRENQSTSERRVQANIQQWKKEKQEYLQKIEHLERELHTSKIKPKQALGTIQVVSDSLEEEDSSLGQSVKDNEKEMAYLEKKFLKRQITEREFRDRMIDLDNKNHILKAKQKEIKAHKQEALKTRSRMEKQLPVSAVSVVRAPHSKAGSKPVRKGKKTATVQYVSQVGATPPPTGNSGSSGAAPPATQGMEKDVRRLLEQKAGGTLTQDRIDSMETKINQLLRKYDLPESRITEEVQKMDQNKLLESFSRLINVLEMESEAKREAQKPRYEIKPAPVETVIPGEKMYKRESTSTLQDIQLKRIVTDFDKVLTFVKDKGLAKEAEIAKQLNVDKKRVREVATILEERGLVKVEFPLIGDMTISDVHYRKPNKKKNKK